MRLFEPLFVENELVIFGQSQAVLLVSEVDNHLIASLGEFFKGELLRSLFGGLIAGSLYTVFTCVMFWFHDFLEFRKKWRFLTG